MSKLFLRTLRDDPADATVTSHKLLVRAGYIRPIAAGIFSWLPLGVIALRNVERVIREEMDEAGFQEVHFPALLPKDAYEATIAGLNTVQVSSAFKIVKAQIIY